MIAKREEVASFLMHFKQKMEIFDVIFLNREKNLQTLLELEIVKISRKEKLQALQVSDFYKGPSGNYNGGADLWEFGKKVKGREVYIKISLGKPNKSVICISFHLAERKIKYPYK